MKKEALAECVGLWLAEGDNKSENELTFTNSSVKLIEQFHDTMSSLIPKNSVRVYAYSKEGHARIPIQNVKEKQYQDIRARKPYFIWRFASVSFMRTWKMRVRECLADKKCYTGILRGFFAGEGNIKTGTHSNRTLRIAQKEQKEFIDLLLDSLGLTYAFRAGDRAYYLSGKWNWDIFNHNNLCGLHPEKKKRFLECYNSFRQPHFRNYALWDRIIEELRYPQISRNLANEFRRSSSRITQVLTKLKKEGIAENFRVYGTDYWILKSQNAVIISSVKQRYLKLISENTLTTAGLARKLQVSYKSAARRLHELEAMKLVTRNSLNEWHRLSTNKRIITMANVMGIDEAGREV